MQIWELVLRAHRELFDQELKIVITGQGHYLLVR
jgi:hypothetical protein